MARVWLCKTKNIKLSEFFVWSLGRVRGGVIRYSFVCFMFFMGEFPISGWHGWL